MSAHPDATGVAMLPAAISGLGSTNGFTGYVLAHGDDNPLVLQEIMEDFLQALGRRSEITGLRSFHSADSPQIKLSVNEEKALALGVEVDDVYNSNLRPDGQQIRERLHAQRQNLSRSGSG